MDAVDFLEQLKAFTEDTIKDVILPVRLQKDDDEPPAPRAASVYLMRLPDSTSALKKAPYIIHQVIIGEDGQEEGKRPTSSVQVRSIFCVYHDDEQQGGLALLGLMERFRIALLRRGPLANRYELDRQTKIQRLIYPDDTAPYYAGEMSTTWKLPAVEREVRQWL